MKAAEKATDRTAYVHIYVEGKVDPVSEYGEYVDPADNAICCYVPLAEDQTIRVGGRFSGTTLAVTYDTLVDGVCRKTASFAPKTVQYQKSKKLDTTTFLYKTKDGTIDAKIAVALLEGVTLCQEKGTETIGIMELRLYITRQLGVTRTIKNMEKYYAAKDHPEHGTKHTAVYNLVAPTFRLLSERDTMALDAQKASREQRKMDSARPGKEPWAIFRFHYRSADAIAKHGLNMSFDANTMESECRTLVLDPVSPLIAHFKPHKDDGDTLTQGSSPAPSDVPLTPVKPSRKRSNLEPPTFTMEQSLKKRSKTTPVSGVEPKASIDQPTDKDVDKFIDQDDDDGIILAESAEVDRDTIAQTTATQLSKATKSVPEPYLGRTTGKSGGQTQIVDSDTIVVATHDLQTNASTKPTATKKSSLSTAIANFINGSSATNETPAQDVINPAFQPLIPSTKKPTIKPAPIYTGGTVTHTEQPTSPTSIISTKRPAPMTTGPLPELKRTKLRPAHLQLTQPEAACSPPTSSSPKSLSIERQVAEQCKNLETLRKKRGEMAEKQSKIDRLMEPYKKRLAEELERLDADIMDEELAFKDEHQHLTASLEMLREFRTVDGGN